MAKVLIKTTNEVYMFLQQHVKIPYNLLFGPCLALPWL